MLVCSSYESVSCVRVARVYLPSINFPWVSPFTWLGIVCVLVTLLGTVPFDSNTFNKHRRQYLGKGLLQTSKDEWTRGPCWHTSCKSYQQKSHRVLAKYCYSKKNSISFFLIYYIWRSMSEEYLFWFYMYVFIYLFGWRNKLIKIKDIPVLNKINYFDMIYWKTRIVSY